MPTSPLKYHGGKHYLAKRLWAIAKTTPHIHRVETHAGSLAFTFAADAEGYSEVANDIDSDLCNFWMVLRNPDYFQSFVRSCQATPFEEQLWGWARDALAKNDGRSDTFLSENEPVKRAWLFFITNRQSLAGRMDNFTGITKTRTRRGMNNEVSAWWSVVDGLEEVYHRIRRILILNKDAIECIQSQDGPTTLFYCDPPYLSSTRASSKVYRHEYTVGQHKQLLNTLKGVNGKFMLSGYRSVLYDTALRSYNRHDFDLANHASSSTTKRRMVECVWCNF